MSFESNFCREFASFLEEFTVKTDMVLQLQTHTRVTIIDHLALKIIRRLQSGHRSQSAQNQITP